MNTVQETRLRELEKLAAGANTRKDPDQRRIVDKKHQINDEIKDVVKRQKELNNLFIASKKVMNGREDPKVLQVTTKSKITEPLPPQLIGAIPKINEEIQYLSQANPKIVTDLVDVARDQAEYAQKHEQAQLAREQQKAKATTPVEQAPAQPAPSAPVESPTIPTTTASRTNELEKLLIQKVSRQVVLDSLLKESSNKLTRIWSHIKAPFGSEKYRWERLALLNAAARMERNLKTIDDHVLSWEHDSVLKALYTAMDFWDDAKASFFSRYKQSLIDIKGQLQAQLSEEKDLTKKITFDNVSPTPVAQPVGEAATVEQVTAPQAPVETPKKEELEQIKPLDIPKVEAPPAVKDLPAEPVKTPAPSVQSPVSPSQTQPQPEATEKPAKTELPAQPEFKPTQQPNVLTQADARIVIEYMLANINYWRDLVNNRSELLGKKYNINNHQLWSAHFDKCVDACQATWAKFARSLSGKWSAIQESYLKMALAIGYYIASMDAAESIFSSTNNKADIDKAIRKREFASLAVRWAGDAETKLEAKKNEIHSRINAGRGDTGAIIKEAGPISRWFNRAVTHLSWAPDKNVRLRTDEAIRESAKAVNSLMDVLEQRNQDAKTIISSVKTFLKKLIDMFDRLSNLASMYNNRLRIEKSTAKFEKQRFPHELISEDKISQIRRIKGEIERDLGIIDDITELENQILQESNARKDRAEAGKAGV